MSCTVHMEKRFLEVISNGFDISFESCTATLMQIASDGIAGILKPFIVEVELPALLMQTELMLVRIRLCNSKHQQPYYKSKDPEFDNMCGRIHLPGKKTRTTCHLKCSKNTKKKTTGLQVPDQLLPPEPSSLVYRNNRTKRGGMSSASRGKQIYTIHGNIVLKNEAGGTSVVFKVFLRSPFLPLKDQMRAECFFVLWQGVRDMKLLSSVLEQVFGTEMPDKDCAYTVHMTIVTGKP